MQDNGSGQKRGYASSKRDAARAATRARLVAAADEVLRGVGWSGFSLEAVARAAGVTRLTVYNQFGSRRALLEALFDQRAITGGFSGIPAAMAVEDPHDALRRLVELFSAFWAGSYGFMPGLLAEIAADSEFAEAMRARNERRRQLMVNLVGRMTSRGEVDKTKTDKLVDTLFALTSYPVYAELAAGRLGPAEVRDIVTHLCAAAVSRFRPG